MFADVNISTDHKIFKDICLCFVENNCEPGPGMKVCLDDALWAVHMLHNKDSSSTKTEL